MNTDTMMTSTILVCTFASLVGVLIGLALAKMQANSETEEAFERGREEGKEEGVRESEERFLKEKEVIKDGLSKNLAGIRDSIVRAVEAYEETVQAVEEQFDVAPGALLGEPEQEQRLLPGSRVAQTAEDSEDLELEADESDAVIDEVEEEISRELSSCNGASKLENRADKEDCSKEDAKECCGAACDSEEDKSAACTSAESDSEEKSADSEKEEEEKKASDSALAEKKSSVLHDNVKIH